MCVCLSQRQENIRWNGCRLIGILDAEVYVSKPYFDLTCSSEIEKRDDDEEEEDNEKFVEEKSWTNDVHEEHVGSWRDVEIRDLRKVRVTRFSFTTPVRSVPSKYSLKHITARGGIEI